MTYYWFGGGIADFAVSAGAGNTVVFAPSVSVTAWNAQTGGTQYALLDANGVAVTSVTTSDGTGGVLAGSLPRFQAPAPAIWLSAAGGPRELVVTGDAGDLAVAAQAAAAQGAADLAAHIAARNPHSTRIDDLSDVDVSDAVTGQVLYLASGGTWRPLTIPGVTGTAQLAGNNTFTGSQVFNPATTLEPGTTSYAAAGQTANRNLVYVAGSTTQLASYLTPGGDERRTPSATGAVGRRLQALAGQSANLEEWADSGGTTRAWVDPTGKVRAGNLGMVFPFSLAGALTTTTGAHRIYNDTGGTLIIRGVRASVGTAPTGADIIVDLNINGSTAFSTQANRPTITAGTNTSGRVTAINTTTLADGDYMTVDVDQIGSTIAGSNLVVQVLAY